MHQMVPTIYYFFWVRYYLSKVYFQKKSWQETKYRPSFTPTTQPHPLNPLDCGPTSLVLAGYRLVVLRPFCTCSTIFCVCLPRRFCRNRLVLFYFAAWLYLISSRISCCVLSFPLVWLLLHAIPAADTSCCSLFLFIVFFHFSSHVYLSFIQKDLGLCGPNNVDWIKRVLGPIYLHLPKPFCQRTVFCGNALFCNRFVFCCRSLSLAFLSLDLSCSLSSWWAFGPYFSLGFPLYKLLGTNSKNRYQQLQCINCY